MAHSQSSEMAVPAVLLHLEDRVDPEALVGREALVVLEVLIGADVQSTLQRHCGEDFTQATTRGLFAAERPRHVALPSFG